MSLLRLLNVQGIAGFGTLSSSPTGRDNRMFQIVDNVTHQAGAHAVRAGVDFLYNADTITYPRSIRGAYTFSSLANFLAGSYNNGSASTAHRRRSSSTSGSANRQSGTLCGAASTVIPHRPGSC